MSRLFLYFAFVLAPFIGRTQTDLQYHLNKDDVFTVKQEAKQVIVQQLDGATHELTNDINGILEFKVLGKIKDNYEIALTFKDLNLFMNSSIQGELMNVKASEVIEGDMQSLIFNSLLNNPVKIIFSKTGDILEVSGGDSLVVKMAKASGVEDEFSLNMMKRSLEKEFGSEALSNNYKQMTFIYPSRAVKVGDTWNNEYTGKLNAKNSWKLEALNDREAKISGMAEVVMNVVEAATTMNLTGNQESMISTRLKSGFIEKMTVEGVFKGVSVMTQMGDQEIPTTITSTITYELINN